jgi:hypothetical protein
MIYEWQNCSRTGGRFAGTLRNGIAPLVEHGKQLIVSLPQKADNRLRFYRVVSP